MCTLNTHSGKSYAAGLKHNRRFLALIAPQTSRNRTGTWLLGYAGLLSIAYAHVSSCDVTHEVVLRHGPACDQAACSHQQDLLTFDSRLSRVSVTALGRVSQSRAAFLMPGMAIAALSGCPLVLQSSLHNEQPGGVVKTQR